MLMSSVFADVRMGSCDMARKPCGKSSVVWRGSAASQHREAAALPRAADGDRFRELATTGCVLSASIRVNFPDSSVDVRL